MYPSNYLYSKEHEWIKVDGDAGILGITHFAQSELGEVVYFEAPEVGDTFNVEDEIGSVESVKAVSSIYTPVSGEIIEVNEAIEDSPELINDDPHGDGWLVKILISNPEELGTLMSAEAYQNFVAAAAEE